MNLRLLCAAVAAFAMAAAAPSFAHTMPSTHMGGHPMTSHGMMKKHHKHTMHGHMMAGHGHMMMGHTSTMSGHGGTMSGHMSTMTGANHSHM